MNTAEPPIARTVGFYHWGGEYPASVCQGVEQIAKLGGRLARVSLSPRYYVDYNLGNGCYPKFSLGEIVTEPDVKRALDNEQIEMFYAHCVRWRNVRRLCPPSTP